MLQMKSVMINYSKLFLQMSLICFSDSHQITPVLHLLTITIRNWKYQNIEKTSFLSAPVGSSTSSFASMAPDLRIPSRDQESGIVFSVLEKPI